MPRDVQRRLLLEELHAMQRWENQPVDRWDVSRLDTREMTQTLEEATPQIERILREPKLQERFREYSEQLRKRAVVEIRQ